MPKTYGSDGSGFGSATLVPWHFGVVRIQIRRSLIFLSLTLKTPTKMYERKSNFLTKFFCILLFEGIFTSFFKDKKSKRSQNIFCYFCLMIEGSGSIPLTNLSGSRCPKNIWIRNTDLKIYLANCSVLWHGPWESSSLKTDVNVPVPTISTGTYYAKKLRKKHIFSWHWKWQDPDPYCNVWIYRSGSVSKCHWFETLNSTYMVPILPKT